MLGNNAIVTNRKTDLLYVLNTTYLILFYFRYFKLETWSSYIRGRKLWTPEINNFFKNMQNFLLKENYLKGLYTQFQETRYFIEGHVTMSKPLSDPGEWDILISPPEHWVFTIVFALKGLFALFQVTFQLYTHNRIPLTFIWSIMWPEEIFLWSHNLT